MSHIREILIVLYNDQSEKAKHVSERQFTVTVAVLTLHLALIAGLIVYGGNVSITDRCLACVALTVFDSLVIFYIFNKCRAYWAVHDSMVALQARLEEYINPPVSAQAPDAHQEPNTIQIPVESAQHPVRLKCYDEGNIKYSVFEALNKGTKGSLVFSLAIICLWSIAIIQIIRPVICIKTNIVPEILCADNTAVKK